MKKYITILYVALCMMVTMPTFAEGAACQNIPIADFAEYLTETQCEELSEKIEEIRNTYTFDLAVYTEPEMTGEDAESAADNIFDYYGYGTGENADGLILYISAEPRVYHLSTHGSGEKIFNQNGLAYLEAQIVPSLQADDYYSAIKLYADHAEELLEMAAQGNPYNDRQLSVQYVCGVVVGAIVLPLLLALWMMKKKLAKMKTAVKNNYAANYMKSGSLQLDMSRDIFLYSTVTKTARSKSNSGGHVSSSGEHHGGRGGSF